MFYKYNPTSGYPYGVYCRDHNALKQPMGAELIVMQSELSLADCLLCCSDYIHVESHEFL